MPLAPQKHLNRLLIPFILSLVLLVVVFIFGLWAFGKMQDYKNNVDQKIAEASEKVKLQTSTAKDKELSEKEKNPLKHYKGPATYGSIDFQYSKTWSAYVDQSNNSTPLNGYFHPDYIPGVQSGTAFALRVQVLNQTYDQELKQLDSKVKNGKVKVAPFRAPNVPSVLGSRAEGEINLGQKDTKIFLPVRDKTLEIWTESDQFVHDLDTIILSSLTYSP